MRGQVSGPASTWNMLCEINMWFALSLIYGKISFDCCTCKCGTDTADKVISLFVTLLTTITLAAFFMLSQGVVGWSDSTYIATFGCPLWIWMSICSASVSLQTFARRLKTYKFELPWAQRSTVDFASNIIIIKTHFQTNYGSHGTCPSLTSSTCWRRVCRSRQQMEHIRIFLVYNMLYKFTFYFTHLLTERKQ